MILLNHFTLGSLIVNSIFGIIQKYYLSRLNTTQNEETTVFMYCVMSFLL